MSRLSDLERISAAIEVLTHDVTLEIASGEISIDEQIALGYYFDDLSKKAAAGREALKASLRKHAIKKGRNPGPLHLNSKFGPTCTVVIPKPEVQTIKNSNIKRLRELLGPRFDLYFHTITTHNPRQDFQQRVSSCENRKERDAVMSVVRIEDGIPRVSFKKN